MTPMQHTPVHPVMPKRRRSRSSPARQSSCAARCHVADLLLKPESSTTTLPELSRTLPSMLWITRARDAPARPRTRAARHPGPGGGAPMIRRTHPIPAPSPSSAAAAAPSPSSAAAPSPSSAAAPSPSSAAAPSPSSAAAPSPSSAAAPSPSSAAAPSPSSAAAAAPSPSSVAGLSSEVKAAPSGSLARGPARSGLPDQAAERMRSWGLALSRSRAVRGRRELRSLVDLRGLAAGLRPGASRRDADRPDRPGRPRAGPAPGRRHKGRKTNSATAVTEPARTWFRRTKRPPSAG